MSTRAGRARLLGCPDRLGPEAPDRSGHWRRHRRNGAAPPGTSAHHPARPSSRCRSPGRCPWWAPTLICHVQTIGAWDRGSGHSHPFWPSSWANPPATGANLASYTGLAPVTRRSGSSIRDEYVSHAGSKSLKRAMFLSTLISLRSVPVSRVYHQRKRDQGTPPWTVLALAHRRLARHIGAPRGPSNDSSSPQRTPPPSEGGHHPYCVQPPGRSHRNPALLTWNQFRKNEGHEHPED